MGTHKIKAICFDYYGTLTDAGQPFITLKNWFAKALEATNPQVNPDAFNMQFTRQRAALSAVWINRMNAEIPEGVRSVSTLENIKTYL